MICDWKNGGLHTCGEEVKGSLDLGEDLKEAVMCSSFFVIVVHNKSGVSLECWCILWWTQSWMIPLLHYLEMNYLECLLCFYNELGRNVVGCDDKI